MTCAACSVFPSFSWTSLMASCLLRIFICPRLFVLTLTDALAFCTFQCIHNQPHCRICWHHHYELLQMSPDVFLSPRNIIVADIAFPELIEHSLRCNMFGFDSSDNGRYRAFVALQC